MTRDEEKALVERFEAREYGDISYTPAEYQRLIDLARRGLDSQNRIEALEVDKDGAYAERNQVVPLLARIALAMGWKAGRRPTNIPGWESAWHGCVWIDLPTGQVSWHYHDSETHLFAALPEYDGPVWDGHTALEKYERVNKALLGKES